MASLLLAVAVFGSPSYGGQVKGRAPAVAHRMRPLSIGLAYTASLWPKVGGVATVYYVIASGSASSATSNIKTAISRFNSDFSGLIQWVAWTSAKSKNYVSIDLSASNTSGVCEANEGYEAVPAQPMGGSANCTVGTILHEMGHVIGLWHEQARPDSSTYVAINYANVIKGSWSYFQPPPDDYQILSPYDYASLMQYTSYAFTRNGEPVIETKPAGIPLAGSEGVPAVSTYDYSAGDKEGIMRLYGAPPKTVTVTSNPVGLQVLVDGATVVTPKSYTWALNSSHTLGVASGVQMLSGDIAASTTSATFYYTYGRWSNSTARNQTITVAPGNGDLAFPASEPAVSTYSANFVQIVPFSAAVSPAGSGSIGASPMPTTYPGATGQFYTAREPIKLTATAASGYSFYEFNNAPFYLPGGLGSNPKLFWVPDTGNPVDTTAEFSDTPVYSVSLVPDTATSNLYVLVDGKFAYTPKNFSSEYDSSWTPGSTHTISFPTPEYPYSSNSRYAFSKFNAAVAEPTPAALRPSARFGGIREANPRPRTVRAHGLVLSGRSIHSRAPAASATAPSETITLPAANTGYGISIAWQFEPATNFGYPPCGGTATISPASPSGDGFYPNEQELTYAATAARGWTFAGWTYDLTGTTNPDTLKASGETLVFANFNITNQPLALSSLSPPGAAAGSAAFTLTLTGTGFAPGSLVVFDGTYLTVSYVSSTQLKVTVPASLVTTAGAYQVAVENFPSGSTGCAVFGYQPFFVAN